MLGNAGWHGEVAQRVVAVGQRALPAANLMILLSESAPRSSAFSSTHGDQNYNAGWRDTACCGTKFLLWIIFIATAIINTILWMMRVSDLPVASVAPVPWPTSRLSSCIYLWFVSKGNQAKIRK